jgi:hypothetical protein
MFGKKEVFIKACPNCLSSKINSHLGFTGEGYKCMTCKLDHFHPLEFSLENLEKARKELKESSE